MKTFEELPREAALRALRDLTGQSFTREPEAGRTWYESHTGKRLTLAGAVHELLVVVRILEDGLEVDGESTASVGEAYVS